MNVQHQLEYAPTKIRSGHSAFGIASICMAILVFLFVVISLYRSPFQSIGNEKETRVSFIAAILGMLLAIRALADPVRKRTLGTLGLCLNALALLAASILLPYI
jgi:uncharacterized RDD family membrane protein YckC